MLLRANGPAIERLINELKVKEPFVTYEEVCRRTEKLGKDKDFMSPRVLFVARKSRRVTATRLHALAHVLGVKVDEIVLKEEPPEHLPVRSAHGGLSFIMNFPPSLIDAEPIQRLAALPAEVVQGFLDVTISLISGQLVGTPEDKQRETLISIAKKQLSQEIEDAKASERFAGTRHPDREKRFEINMRSIIEKAVKYFVSRDAPRQKPEQTFLDYFLEYAQKVSDADLQELWAQVLAAKIQRPDGLSLRTLRLIQDINQDVAERFAKLCGIVFIVEEDYVSVRLDDTEEFLSWAGLSFDDLLVVADYGLVTLGVRAFEVDAGVRFRYFDFSFQALRKVKFRGNLLTAAGRELFQLVRPVHSQVYFQAVRQKFGVDAGPIEKAR